MGGGKKEEMLRCGLQTEDVSPLFPFPLPEPKPGERLE